MTFRFLHGSATLQTRDRFNFDEPSASHRLQLPQMALVRRRLRSSISRRTGLKRTQSVRPLTTDSRQNLLGSDDSGFEGARRTDPEHRYAHSHQLTVRHGQRGQAAYRWEAFDSRTRTVACQRLRFRQAPRSIASTSARVDRAAPRVLAWGKGSAS